jgi:hypothetical protein
VDDGSPRAGSRNGAVSLLGEGDPETRSLALPERYRPIQFTNHDVDDLKPGGRGVAEIEAGRKPAAVIAHRMTTAPGDSACTKDQPTGDRRVYAERDGLDIDLHADLSWTLF